MLSLHAACPVCIAPVCEDRGLFGHHHRAARRAFKAGEPRQPLRKGADIFAHMLVGERHHEAIERLALQLIAKPSESGGISGHSGSSNWCWQASQVDQVDALVGCLFTTPTKGAQRASLMPTL